MTFLEQRAVMSATLIHPSLFPVYGVWEEVDLPDSFMVLQQFSTSNLVSEQQKVPGAFPRSIICHIAGSVLHALDVIHSSTVQVHGNVKSEVRRQKHVKVPFHDGRACRKELQTPLHAQSSASDGHSFRTITPNSVSSVLQNILLGDGGVVYLAMDPDLSSFDPEEEEDEPGTLKPQHLSPGEATDDCESESGEGYDSVYEL